MSEMKSCTRKDHWSIEACSADVLALQSQRLKLSSFLCGLCFNLAGKSKVLLKEMVLSFVSYKHLAKCDVFFSTVHSFVHKYNLECLYWQQRSVADVGDGHHASVMQLWSEPSCTSVQMSPSYERGSPNSTSWMKSLGEPGWKNRLKLCDSQIHVLVIPCGKTG